MLILRRIARFGHAETVNGELGAQTQVRRLRSADLGARTKKRRPRSADLRAQTYERRSGSLIALGGTYKIGLRYRL